MTEISANAFDNVESMEVVPEMSGTALHIRMKNGGLLIVAPENDAVVFFRDAKKFDEGEDYTGAMLCDFGSGHHEPAETDKVHFHPL